MGFSWQYIIGSKIDLCHQRSFQVCIWCLRKRVCQNVSQIHISPAIYLNFPHIKPFSQDTFITQTLSRRIDRIWNYTGTSHQCIFSSAAKCALMGGSTLIRGSKIYTLTLSLLYSNLYLPYKPNMCVQIDMELINHMNNVIV